jgi:hypothetical protein
LIGGNTIIMLKGSSKELPFLFALQVPQSVV